jgi:hypothetical protein
VGPGSEHSGAEHYHCKPVTRMGKIGGGNRTRTDDPLLANYLLSVEDKGFHLPADCEELRRGCTFAPYSHPDLGFFATLEQSLMSGFSVTAHPSY